MIVPKAQFEECRQFVEELLGVKVMLTGDLSSEHIARCMWYDRLVIFRQHGEGKRSAYFEVWVGDQEKREQLDKAWISYLIQKGELDHDNVSTSSKDE